MRGGLQLALILLFVCALVLLAVFTLQRKLIYFPTRLDPVVAERVARQNQILPWHNKKGQTIGWQWPAGSPSAGAVLVVHGNAGSALDREYMAEPIRSAAQIDVFVLEYPGYGVRDGFPSQLTFHAAGEEAFEALSSRHPIFIVSESIGAGVATHVAKVHGPRVAGLLLFAPFTTLRAVAQRAMPFLPMGLVLRDRFDPEGSLAAYRGPIAFVLAEADEIIPAEFGRRLYESYAGPKKLVVIAGARHNDIAGQSPSWWREIFGFWQKHAR